MRTVIQQQTVLYCSSFLILFVVIVSFHTVSIMVVHFIISQVARPLYETASVSSFDLSLV